MKHNELFHVPSLIGRAAAVTAALALVSGAAHAAVSSTGDGSLSASSESSSMSEADKLAKQLSNPVAAAVSIPFQNNFDWGGGPRGDGFQWKMNFQPVIPFKLNDRWNLVTRAIIPVINQTDIAGTYLNPSGTQTGLGDSLVSAWISPADASNDLVWGLGPAVMIPTGGGNLLTSNQWAAGPTAILLKMGKRFTYGGLINHLWSYAGNGGRPGTNASFIQPFVVYLAGGGWTVILNSETTYNWQASEATIPVNLMLNKMSKICNTPVQWQAGVRWYAVKPDNGPEWGLRFSLTFLLPRS